MYVCMGPPGKSLVSDYNCMPMGSSAPCQFWAKCCKARTISRRCAPRTSKSP